MANQLFDRLYDEAYRREHVRIQRVIGIRREYPEADWITCARICDETAALGPYFEQQLTDIANRNRMRVRRGRYQCACGDPNCEGAIFVPDGVVLLTQADLKKYYGGK